MGLRQMGSHHISRRARPLRSVQPRCRSAGHAPQLPAVSCTACLLSTLSMSCSHLHLVLQPAFYTMAPSLASRRFHGRHNLDRLAGLEWATSECSLQQCLPARLLS